MPRRASKKNELKIKKNSKALRAEGKRSARRHFHGRAGAKSKPRQPSLGKLFEGLVAVQTRLRAPGGCPWDREQTHETLRSYLIEEAYEALDAIEQGSAPEMAEELGDLLLQVLFHADIGREAGTFELSDVITAIKEKLIRRHPHVFGNVKAETASEVLKNWAKLKAKEKAEKLVAQGVDTGLGVTSIIGDVPRSLPALLEAYQLTRKAAQVGFDWTHPSGVLQKLHEELKEIQVAIESEKRDPIEEEVGDILFTAVNLARLLKLDPEVTLKRANLKFKRRFQEMERSAAESGRNLSQLSADELDRLWEAVKSSERSSNGAAPSA